MSLLSCPARKDFKQKPHNNNNNNNNKRKKERKTRFFFMATHSNPLCKLYLSNMHTHDNNNSLRPIQGFKMSCCYLSRFSANINSYFWSCLINANNKKQKKNKNKKTNKQTTTTKHKKTQELDMA